MGTNSKTAHTPYSVATTAADGLPIEPPQETDLHPDGEALALVAVIVHGGDDPDDPHGQPAVDLPDDVVEHYAIFAEAVHDALKAQADGQQLRALCAEYFAVMDADSLEQVATAQGFEYAALVGISGQEPNPFAHWLDPSIPSGAESKEKIQALALNRFASLCAGEEIGGLNLAGWQGVVPGLTATTQPVPIMFKSWRATEADVAEAQAALALALETPQGKLDASEIAALISCENKLATARNPALAGQLNTAVAAARHQVDQLLTYVSAEDLSTAIAVGQSTGSVTWAQPQVIGPDQMVKLLRASTPADERAHLDQLVTERTTQLAELGASAVKIDNALPSLTSTTDAAKVAELVGDIRTMVAVGASASIWNAVHPAPLHSSTLQDGQAEVLSWAHDHKLADLRAFATTIGLVTAKEASAASKATLTQLLHHHVTGNDTPAKALKSQLSSQPKPAPAVTNGGSPQRSRFSSQHAQLVAALRQAQAAHAAVPKALATTAVEAWDFGPGTPANLGGTHPKTLHTGPDGTTWIAKAEGTPRGGAVTQAEAAASRILARAGLPAVPVYATTINGKSVSVQPMLTGATPMANSPASWSQADVDAVVRLHVTSWALGNHDAHHGNVLRTKDGGLVPVDQGQSFKNYGSDKLALDYKPSTTTVYDNLYTAHLVGKLPKGVQVNPAVAHAVIKQLESVPDAEWRAMLHTTAYAGASQPMKWVPPMRTRAAKRHNIPETAVTTNQIAEAFLDYAVERKTNLRRDFTAFFTQDLKLSAAAALKHLGKH